MMYAATSASRSTTVGAYYRVDQAAEDGGCTRCRLESGAVGGLTDGARPALDHACVYAGRSSRTGRARGSAADHLTTLLRERVSGTGVVSVGDRLDRLSRREPDFGLFFVPMAVIGTAALPAALAQRKWWGVALAIVFMALSYPVVWHRFRRLAADEGSTPDE